MPESADGSHLITLWKKTKDFPGLGEPPNEKHHLQLFIDQLISNSTDGCEEIYGDMCCSDADYEDRPYYEIFEVKD